MNLFQPVYFRTREMGIPKCPVFKLRLQMGVFKTIFTVASESRHMYLKIYFLGKKNCEKTITKKINEI